MKNPILLFDGVCNLCNGTVQQIIKADKNGIFRFASLQSDFGQEQLKQFNLEGDYLKTLVLISDEKAYIRSDAALEIARQLGGLWSVSYIFKIVPPFIRNAVYDFISNNRYHWFGKQESCMIPTSELKARFLG